MGSALNQLIAQHQGPDLVGSAMQGMAMADQQKGVEQDRQMKQQQISLAQRQLAQSDAAGLAKKQVESDKYFANVAYQLQKDPANKAQIWAAARSDGERRGFDVHKLPLEITPEAEAGLNNLFSQVYGGEQFKADLNRKPVGASSAVGKLYEDRQAAAASGATPEQLKAYDDAIAREGRKSDGTNISLTVNPEGKQELTKTTASDVQGQILDAEKELSSLDSIANKYSGDFLTYKGRAKAFVGKQFDRAGAEGELSTFNAKRTSFKNEVNQFFNKYKKEITGAAAGEQEMIDLRNSIFNEDLGPEEFRSAYNQFVEKARKNYEMNKRTARTGVDVAVDPKYKDMTDADLKKALGL